MPSSCSGECLLFSVTSEDITACIRGKTEYAKIDLDEIETPILVTPGSNLCFTVKGSCMRNERNSCNDGDAAGSKQTRTFCCENLGCRDAWWKALVTAANHTMTLLLTSYESFRPNKYSANTGATKCVMKFQERRLR
eukprot:GHVQ01026772.1.p1 GENE.GHVQ01026772.1~~GHVQ01026772.1.p1  ORF type:complete len:137 (-),score=11.05 GHVQ01026772.1:616-1026(-)